MSLNIIKQKSKTKKNIPSKIDSNTNFIVIPTINEVAYSQSKNNFNMALDEKTIQNMPLRQRNKIMTQDNSVNLRTNLNSKEKKKEFVNVTNSELQVNNSGVTRSNMRSQIKKQYFKASKRAMHSDIRVRARHKFNRANNEIDSSKNNLTRNGK